MKFITYPINRNHWFLTLFGIKHVDEILVSAAIIAVFNNSLGVFFIAFSKQIVVQYQNYIFKCIKNKLIKFH